jgi:platelet-activating factor acetylhydrolase
LQTVFFTLYYPIAKGATSSRPQHLWFPQPRDLIADGLSRASGINIPSGIIEALIASIADQTTIPAQVDVSILNANSSSYPLLVFSHGDVSLANWYSGFNGEMASRGVVAAAIQHRDGSAAGTVVDFGNGTTKNVSYLATTDVK